jgi:LPS-assembly lipoprotein
MAARLLLRFWFVPLLALSLAGCGFRLQTPADLPEGIRTAHVAATDLLTPFAVELRRGLERAGLEVLPSEQGADVVIRVRRDRTGRRVLSVSARNTPQEFEIWYVVDYSIERPGSDPVVAQPLELTRNLTFDERLLLAKDHEEALLRDAMARDLADLVLRRLQSL